MILTVLYASAGEQQFYLVAKPTPEGVYLRWDVVEGDYPSADEIDYMVLRRDDENISRFSPEAVMSEDEIRAFYLRSENEAGLKRLIDRIAKNSNGACSGANVSNFASVLQSCLQDPAWRYLAAKADYNVALVEHRAYIDRRPLSGGVVTYELVAVKDTGAGVQTKRLGKVTLDPTVPASVLAPKNFKQVRQSVACTAPEYAKDDYTVSLSWENGGNKTDSFVNSMLLSGYDLYRATSVNAGKLATEISDLAKSAPVDDAGNYRISGLEKINETPIMLANKPGDETPLYLETSDALKKAGLKPGESRWYYLVPRDFTGAYGPMKALEVTIPDLLPPVAPWNVRSVEEEGKVKLVWDRISVENYVRHYKNNRKFCNLNSFTTDKRLYFADKSRSCGSRDMAVNLNVKRYYIYRFDNPSEAARFADHDMDGIADRDENEGQECVANVINDNNRDLAKHLIGHIDTSDIGQEDFVTFVDTNVTKGKYYWYRVAAATKTTPSTLTPPLQVLLPDRRLPKKPKLTLSVCASNYVVSSYSLDGVTPYLAYDETGEAREVKITCSGNTGTTFFQKDIYLPVGSDGYVKANGFNPCSCKAGVITFLDEHRKTLASKPLCSGCTRATEFYVLKDYDCSFGGYEVVHDGVDLTNWPIADLPEPIAEDECIEFTVMLGGKRFKAARNCEEKQHFDLADLGLPNLGEGEKYCIGMSVYNANNQHSPTAYAPCFGIVDMQAPNKPSVRKIVLNDDNITVGWLSPQEKIASTIVKLYNEENATEVYLRSYPQPDHMEKAPHNGMTRIVDIDAALTALNRTQKWCAKAKSVGFNGKVSAWSAPLCTQNEALSGPFEAMPWPHIDSVSGSSGLNFVYDMTNSSLVNMLASKLVQLPFSDPDEYTYAELEQELESVLKDVKLNFTYYRQEITEDGAGNFIQVSPLINHLKIVRSVQITKFAAGGQKLYEFQGGLYLYMTYKDGKDSTFAQLVLFYKDEYPYFKDRNYRYVKVYYTDDHEVERYEVSDVVRTGAPPPTTSISGVPTGTAPVTVELAPLNPEVSNLHLIDGLQLTGGTQ